ncbi:MAG: GDP-mannose 4,6-dehydratase [Candidatus Obscuribacterales bacterium]|nr:GDP-mannose 4,6-dehydratase [Candidatus Obscuribacterales bacterium]
MRVAVIGSNSFSGSDFVDLLLEDKDNHVIGISRSPEKSSVFLPYKRHNGALKGKFVFHQFDLNNEIEKIIDLLDEFQPNYIVNFAAQSEVGPSWDYPEHWFQTNTVSLARLIKALAKRDYLHRYVHISSPEVYGSCEGTVLESAPLNPTTPYAASKAAADLLLFTYVKNFDFPLVMIRSTNVYGPHQQLWKIIPRTVLYLKSGKKISLHGGGKAVKSYIHIRDISRGELDAMLRGKPGGIYHLSPDNGVSVRAVVEMICTRMGYDFSEFTEDVAERLGQDKAYVIDSTRARKELGWRPKIGIEKGVCNVIDWMEEDWEQIIAQPHEYVHNV